METPKTVRTFANGIPPLKGCVQQKTRNIRKTIADDIAVATLVPYFF